MQKQIFLGLIFTGFIFNDNLWAASASESLDSDKEVVSPHMARLEVYKPSHSIPMKYGDIFKLIKGQLGIWQEEKRLPVNREASILSNLASMLELLNVFVSKLDRIDKLAEHGHACSLPVINLGEVFQANMIFKRDEECLLAEEDGVWKKDLEKFFEDHAPTHPFLRSDASILSNMCALYRATCEMRMSYTAKREALEELAKSKKAKVDTPSSVKGGGDARAGATGGRPAVVITSRYEPTGPLPI